MIVTDFPKRHASISLFRNNGHATIYDQLHILHEAARVFSTDFPESAFVGLLTLLFRAACLTVYIDLKVFSTLLVSKILKFYFVHRLALPNTR
jgi:hypothetical protein